jgi:hypothetical protein
MAAVNGLLPNAVFEIKYNRAQRNKIGYLVVLVILSTVHGSLTFLASRARCNYKAAMLFEACLA